MPWEYLETQALDCRLLMIAGYLSDRITNKHIVDLNCGSARLLHYLPKTYAHYYGNDISPFFIENARSISENIRSNFEHATDVDAVKNLQDKPIDILLSIGHGAGHVILNKWESATQTNSILSLAQSHSPEIIILEAATFYEKRCGHLFEILNLLSDKYFLEHAAVTQCYTPGLTILFRIKNYFFSLLQRVKVYLRLPLPIRTTDLYKNRTILVLRRKTPSLTAFLPD